MQLKSKETSNIFDVCILKSLQKGESYAYQVIKDVEKFLEVPAPSIYAAFKRLENTECIILSRQDVVNNHVRKYYQITDKGAARLQETIQYVEKVLVIYKYLTQ